MSMLNVEEIVRNLDLWKNLLIVYIVGGDFLFSYMENYIVRNWNSVAKFELFLYDECYFVVRF